MTTIINITNTMKKLHIIEYNKLAVFLSNFDNTCSMFNEFYIQLSIDIGIYNFRGTPFIMYY